MSIINELKNELLSERFYHADKINKLSTARKSVYVEIFINPSPSELIELKSHYRVIRGGVYNGNIYTWRGNILHDNASEIMMDKLHEKNFDWDYRFIYDPSSPTTLEIYDSSLIKDIPNVNLIKKIFPKITDVVDANSGEHISSI